MKNTGVVFHALTERHGLLRQLVVNSNDVFSATAAEQNALARTFDILPTFEDESKATLARLQTSRQRGPGRQRPEAGGRRLKPTVQDLAALAPNLRDAVQEQLPPLIAAAKPNFPNGERILRGASPLMDGLHTFFPRAQPDPVVLELLPGGAGGLPQHRRSATNYKIDPPINGAPLDTLSQFGVINQRSVSVSTTIPSYDRGNAYLSPNAYDRATKFGVIESLTCPNGQQKDPDPQAKTLPASRSRRCCSTTSSSRCSRRARRPSSRRRAPMTAARPRVLTDRG